MSEIISFDDLKNKATDKDLDKFEQYVYGLYASIADGTLNMSEFMTKIKDYMNKNNISEEKFSNIQKKLMEKYSNMYGFNLEDIKGEMKSLGIDMKDMGIDFDSLNYESIRKSMSFNEKYNLTPQIKQTIYYNIKNEVNDLTIEINDNNVMLKSKSKVNLQDSELNEFLCSYKKLFKDKLLKVTVCENVSVYEY